MILAVTACDVQTAAVSDRSKAGETLAPRLVQEIEEPKAPDLPWIHRRIELPLGAWADPAEHAFAVRLRPVQRGREAFPYSCRMLPRRSFLEGSFSVDNSCATSDDKIDIRYYSLSGDGTLFPLFLQGDYEVSLRPVLPSESQFLYDRCDPEVGTWLASGTLQLSYREHACSDVFANVNEAEEAIRRGFSTDPPDHQESTFDGYALLKLTSTMRTTLEGVLNGTQSSEPGAPGTETLMNFNQCLQALFQEALPHTWMEPEQLAAPGIYTRMDGRTGITGQTTLDFHYDGQSHIFALYASEEQPWVCADPEPAPEKPANVFTCASENIEKPSGDFLTLLGGVHLNRRGVHATPEGSTADRKVARWEFSPSHAVPEEKRLALTYR